MTQHRGSDLESGFAVIVSGIMCAFILLPIKYYITQFAGNTVGYIFLAIGGIMLGRPLYMRIFRYFSSGK